MSKEEYPIINGVTITPGIIALHRELQTPGALDTQIDILNEVVDFVLVDCNSLSIDEDKENVMKRLLMVRDLHNLIKDLKSTRI